VLNNITNFFNLIKTGKVKTQLDASDLLAIGTRDLRFIGQYQPTMIKYSDLVAGLVGGTNGQVLFRDNNTFGGSNNLFWDKVNNRLGVGTTIPANTLDVNGTVRVTGVATIQTLTVGLGTGSQSNNTVLGLDAFTSNTSGNFNVAIGPRALNGNTTGTGNIGIGHFSGVQISNGTNNVAIGREALSNGNSSGNVVVGMQACNTTTGNNNVVLGLQAQAGNFSNSIVIGNSAIGTGNNSVVLGNDSITTTVLKGNVGIGTSTPAGKVTIFGGGGIYTTTSASVNSDITMYDENLLSYFQLTKRRSTATGSFGLPVGSSEIFCNTAFGINSNNYLAFAQNNTERMRIAVTTGNVLINTTTDAGFNLDINGTARVTGIATFGTGTAVTRIQGNLIYLSNGDATLDSSALISYASGFKVGTIPGFVFHLVSGNNPVASILNGRGMQVSDGTSSTPNASSVLDLVSTTKGFLPPRMTSAQRTAIASPAVGLMVYQTDGTEGLYIFRSTGWALNS